jgi:hypothetical protein
LTNQQIKNSTIKSLKRDALEIAERLNTTFFDGSHSCDENQQIWEEMLHKINELRGMTNRRFVIWGDYYHRAGEYAGKTRIYFLEIDKKVLIDFPVYLGKGNNGGEN